MKKVWNYIKSEWKYWLVALVAAIGIGHSAAVEARPIYRYMAGQFSIVQDADYNSWYIKYRKTVHRLDKPYDDIKIIWSGNHKGKDIVLLSGQQGRQCEVNLHLFWSNKEGWIEEDKDFNLCYANHISASIVGDMLVIKIDGKVKRVPL